MSMLIRVIIKIYLRVIISVILFLFLFSVKTEEEKTGQVIISPNFWGVSLFTIKVPLPKVWLVRTILFCSSVATLSTLLFVDFSVFFPEELKVQAFFDQEGIRVSLKAFSDDELKRLGIPDNYEQFQKKYYDDVNIVLGEFFQKSKDTIFRGKDFYSIGAISFVVQKLDGIQNYYIKEAGGQLKHTLVRPNTLPLTFRTSFEKRYSRHDYLSPSLKEIFIKYTVIIQPRFKQIFEKDEKSGGETFDHILVCVTKVYFFPFPRLSNTIYMTELEGIGLIPVGYGIYR